MIKTETFLVDNSIEKDSTRVKAFIINKKKNEVLLAYSNGGCQLPGGHVEELEDNTHALSRELLEETGMVFDGNFTEFFHADYVSKKTKRVSRVIYHYIYTEKNYNQNLTKLTSRERDGNFSLSWVKLNDLPRILGEVSRTTDIPINLAIARELLIAYNTLLELL